MAGAGVVGGHHKQRSCGCPVGAQHRAEGCNKRRRGMFHAAGMAVPLTTITLHLLQHLLCGVRTLAAALTPIAAVFLLACLEDLFAAPRLPLTEQEPLYRVCCGTPVLRGLTAHVGDRLLECLEAGPGLEGQPGEGSRNLVGSRVTMRGPPFEAPEYTSEIFAEHALNGAGKRPALCLWQLSQGLYGSEGPGGLRARLQQVCPVVLCCTKGHPQPAQGTIHPMSNAAQHGRIAR
mmetsp:Transcript_42632/g.110180  ORF Transcript_42632/g.110180 Transcript_42632/m.110180 type:complete len:234 (+) Transcript_42632:931-1632(+)